MCSHVFPSSIQPIPVPIYIYIAGVMHLLICLFKIMCPSSSVIKISLCAPFGRLNYSNHQYNKIQCRSAMDVMSLLVCLLIIMCCDRHHPSLKYRVHTVRQTDLNGGRLRRLEDIEIFPSALRKNSRSQRWLVTLESRIVTLL